LIGVPTTVAENFYSKIQGARAVNVQGLSGYYEYPCTTQIALSLQFGDVSYAVSNGDFNLGQFTSNAAYCTGAIYAQALGSQSPIQWIVGATFLKNVYSWVLSAALKEHDWHPIARSVFRYNPTAIGFAALSNNASSLTTATAATTAALATSSASNGGGGSSGGGSSSSSAAGLGFQVMPLAVVAGLLVSTGLVVGATL
jgi:hypothetical protein